MATIREVILSNQQKEDGTYNVKIRVIHQRKVYYLKTQHFIRQNQLRKDNTIKDPIILRAINPVIDGYRTKISELGPKLELYNMSRLINYLTNNDVTAADQVNVIEFGRKKVEELNAAGRKASASNMRTVINSLVDYFKSDFVPITEIRAKTLLEYEKYLRSERKLERTNQFKPHFRTVPGLSDTGLHNHMRDLRILFNNIKDHYNDEDLEIAIVKHYPFKKYKLVNVTERNKPKLIIEQLISIRDFDVLPNSRMELARDLFMLSFYLCGMNAVDLHKLTPDKVLHDRVNYNRSKTKSRRQDRAFISISIPEIATSLYSKYAGKLQLRYSTHNNLDRALSKGLREIGVKLAIPNLEFYDARHAFADWARNKCRYSKDDVGLALNHKDQTNSVTDIYISKNWGIIDELQESVIRLLTDYKHNECKLVPISHLNLKFK
ncbi:phage integrase SAM-like domain-containing protein [Mucilaginibacter sp. X5P1]|uniref:phage integrase SAM-like domain-containing protein n=1 Tax=Mucilaginibacter sp. X5P1 TaxID=2723088 RepID=UPI00160A2ECA|nr:phage integrase SAM-like domain-containing protein [Mucilaginibacter sp. X5P1]MBB6141837.1 integrase [Mucilaginibacter sp. X5P1]